MVLLLYLDTFYLVLLVQNIIFLTIFNDNFDQYASYFCLGILRILFCIILSEYFFT